MAFRFRPRTGVDIYRHLSNNQLIAQIHASRGASWHAGHHRQVSGSWLVGARHARVTRDVATAHQLQHLVDPARDIRAEAVREADGEQFDRTELKNRRGEGNRASLGPDGPRGEVFLDKESAPWSTLCR